MAQRAARGRHSADRSRMRTSAPDDGIAYNEAIPVGVEMSTTQNVAIRVHGVSKTYRLWTTPASRLTVPAVQHLSTRLAAQWPWLQNKLEAWVSRRMSLHHALTDVSFEVPRGSALGVIGLNGAGKSTLLQIVAGVLQPSYGTVQISGRVAALLELGSGFNLEMTGRENVLLNAAVIGMPRARANALMEQILEFADIGDYVDQPVKTYSTGMALRLAFAVQVHIEPEVLIVDEALAVGDAAFQARAMARIEQILARGTTLLFVGHDLNAVRAFCHRAILLEKGRVVLNGSPEDVVTEYLYRVHQQARIETTAARRSADLQRLNGGYGHAGTGIRHARINGVEPHVSVMFDSPISLDLIAWFADPVAHPTLIVDVMDGKGLQVTGRRISLPPGARGAVEVGIRLRATLQKGVYRLRLRLVDAPTLEQTETLSRQEGLLSFDVVDDSRAQFTGLFPLPMDIEVRPQVASALSSSAPGLIT